MSFNVGERIYCTECHRQKKPIGRSAPLEMASGLCDDDCPGYRKSPEPDSLWPGETRDQFGYPSEGESSR